MEDLKLDWNILLLTIISFHLLHTCWQLCRVSRLSSQTIIMMSPKITSGRLFQSTYSSIVLLKYSRSLRTFSERENTSHVVAINMMRGCLVWEPVPQLFVRALLLFSSPASCFFIFLQWFFFGQHHYCSFEPGLFFHLPFQGSGLPRKQTI